MRMGAGRRGVCDGLTLAFYEFARLNALSEDGHCRAYADDATGTVWSEGAGILLIETEARARRLGHRVYGRILAVRTNHNGKGKPILVPGRTRKRRLSAGRWMRPKSKQPMWE